jgi:hypothetical protein
LPGRPRCCILPSDSTLWSGRPSAASRGERAWGKVSA